MYKAFLETLEQAGITLPSWLFVIIAIVLACAILIFLFRKYVLPLLCKVIKIIKNIGEIEHIKTVQIRSINKSIEKDRELEGKINTLDSKMDNIVELLNNMEAKSNETKMIEMQDRLVQMYRYYTSPEHNGEWNEVEEDTFWKLFRDYENRGGNGYMHQIVEPAMRKLVVKKIIQQ